MIFFILLGIANFFLFSEHLLFIQNSSFSNFIPEGYPSKNVKTNKYKPKYYKN